MNCKCVKMLMQSPQRLLADTTEALECINKSEAVPRPLVAKALDALSQNKTLAFSAEGL